MRTPPSLNQVRSGGEAGVAGGAGVPPATRGVSRLFGTGAGHPDRRRDASATTMRQVEEGEHHRFSEAAKRLCRISFRLAGQFQTESLADQTDDKRLGPAAGVAIGRGGGNAVEDFGACAEEGGWQSGGIGDQVKMAARGLAYGFRQHQEMSEAVVPI